MTDQAPISQDAHDELQAEITRLETVERAAIAERILVAREDGDLKENAEYHAAKNDQSFLETKILKLRDQLQNSVVVEVSDNANAVSFGSTVRLLSLKSDKEVSFTIVSSYDQDISQGKLSVSSPVGAALMGAEKGATVKAQLPNGTINEFKVLEIG